MEPTRTRREAAEAHRHSIAASYEGAEGLRQTVREVGTYPEDAFRQAGAGTSWVRQQADGTWRHQEVEEERRHPHHRAVGTSSEIVADVPAAAAEMSEPVQGLLHQQAEGGETLRVCANEAVQKRGSSHAERNQRHNAK